MNKEVILTESDGEVNLSMSIEYIDEDNSHSIFISCDDNHIFKINSVEECETVIAELAGLCKLLKKSSSQAMS